jgi:hypothetical protein
VLESITERGKSGEQQVQGLQMEQMESILLAVRRCRWIGLVALEKVIMEALEDHERGRYIQTF